MSLQRLFEVQLMGIRMSSHAGSQNRKIVSDRDVGPPNVHPSRRLFESRLETRFISREIADHPNDQSENDESQAVLGGYQAKAPLCSYAEHEGDGGRQ